MDNNLYTYLKSLDLQDEDIEVLLCQCPNLDFIDGNNALLCADVLIQAGYPKEDIDSLICINPRILTYNPEELKIKLSSLSGDIEQILKYNPFII